MQSDRIKAEGRDRTYLRSTVVIRGHQRSSEVIKGATRRHQPAINSGHSQSVAINRNQPQSAIIAYVKGERLVGRSSVKTIWPIGLVEPARKEDGAAVELRARDGVHGAQVPVGSEAPW